MPSPYRDLLDKIRLAFPRPVSDKVHDSYFVHSILRAIDRVDDLKTEVPLLGKPVEPDYDAARQAALRPKSASIEDVTAELVGYLQGMPIHGHPRFQENVIPPPSIASLIGILLSALYNPNLCWDAHSRLIALAEVEIASIAARLVGYDPVQSAGLFTFGGTGTTLYGVKIGLEKACPNTMSEGIREPAYLFASEAAHYCKYNIAGWLGLGANRFVSIPCDQANEIDLTFLEHRLREVIEQGGKIAAIIATMGSTDAFGLDNLEAIVALRDSLADEYKLPYRPHVHADAVIGWAWSVFNDYNIDANPLGFRRRTVRAIAGACRRLRHLHLADSVGIDYHKTGFVPYVSSQVLLKDRRDLDLLSRDPEQMPYLYHFGAYKPGMFTLETSRSGTGIMAALANLRLLGQEGLQVMLGHLVEMAQLLREHLEGYATTTVLNRDNFGAVTIFRVYPPEVDTFAIKQQEFGDPAYRDVLRKHNDYNRRIFQYMHDEAMAGRGVLLSLTDCYRPTSYGEPIVGLKSFILSPFVDEEHVQTVVDKVREAQAKVPVDG
ncbi:MAG: aspartate aminotransferase family protein [Planctomycetes bacterium]|nr:aspartate aminotransferase family protein [Planctomycetota bacterium]